MKTFHLFSLSSMLLLLCCSCGQQQAPENHSVFSQNTPDSPLYKAELERQIRAIGADRLDYHVEGYTERQGEAYLWVNVQGKGLSAIAEMTVPDWQKLGKIRENQGLGYRGAKLDGLQFDILDDSPEVQFVFRDLRQIID